MGIFLLGGVKSKNIFISKDHRHLTDHAVFGENMSGIRMFCSCGAWEMSEKKRSKPQGIQRKLGLDLWG